MITGGPKVVTSGLVMLLDAVNQKSYPVSGTIWYDLCGNYNGTLNNSPEFTTTAMGELNVSSTPQQTISVPTINLTTGSFTIMGASRYSGSSHARMINAINNNWLMGHWNNSTENYYANNWVTAAQTGSNDTKWRVYATTGNTVSDNWKLYVNGTKMIDNASGDQGPNGIEVSDTGTEKSDGQVGFIMAYNRVLTDAEIIQNFNAVRSRYGL